MEGITAIVATILLVLITVSLAGVTAIFLNRIQSVAAQAGEEQLENTLSQIGTSFKIDNVDRNKVFIRNLGNRELKNLDFFVNNVRMETAPMAISPKETGEIILDDSKIAMMPDPAELKVVSGKTEVKEIVSFYDRYTIGHWKFDEGAGLTAKDSSSRNNDGQIAGAQWADGVIKNALNFDGLNDFVNVTNSLSLRPASITIQAWVKFNSQEGSNTGGSPKGQQFLIFKRNSRIGNVTAYNITKQAVTNKLVFSLNNNSGAQAAVASQPVETGKWYHVVATFDNRTKNMSIYMDGVRKASVLLPSTFALGHSESSLYFGRAALGFDAFFNGTLDDVRIMNTARSMEIA